MCPQVTADSSELHEAVARQADQVTAGDTASVMEFIKSFGSHYVRSFVTGNTLFQVSQHTLYNTVMRDFDLPIIHISTVEILIAQLAQKTNHLFLCLRVLSNGL